jgi:DNA polymerase I-like protein with 3'-5' exonuclease and polymerase domains
MGDERKPVLKLKGDKDFFVHFDFKHMEVSMLQWLTGDEALKQAMSDSSDLYRGIYQVVFKEPCNNDAKREMIKRLFLPIMFGQTPQGLEKEYGVSYQSANQLHRLIREGFPTAWKYMEDHHERVKSAPTTKDHFGRVRSFTEKPLSVRGFMVQAASAIFCQEKLIELYNSLDTYGNLIYSIHDGYVLVANQENLNRVVVNGLKALQSESKMCAGLSLKVSCSIGVRLNHLKQIPTSKERNGNG